MVVTRIMECLVQFGIEFYGDNGAFRGRGGIEEAQVGTGGPKGGVGGREEESEAVPADRVGAGVGYGEGEVCGEGSREVGSRVEESEGEIEEGGAGAGGGDASDSGEADGAIAVEVGIAEEGEVAEGQGLELEGED